MKKEYDAEFHQPAEARVTAETWQSLDEAIHMEREFPKPETVSAPYDEYAGGNTIPEDRGRDKHRQIKRMMLVPIASAVAVVSLVFSAFHYDPLGMDFLNAETGIPSDTGSAPSETGGSPSYDAGERADDAFPILSNLEPDFEGNYAWSGEGSEEYIRFLYPDESTHVYLEMGSVWASFGSYDSDGQYVPNHVTEVPNARYDADSNTLTLENFTASVLDVNLMGNGFTIRLVGENRLDQLIVWGAGYGGSVTLTGSGSLTVNENGSAQDGVGIEINGEWSQSCLMIDRSVTLDVYGNPAIMIGATSMSKAIYYLKPLRMTGGIRTAGEFLEYLSTEYDEDGNIIGHMPVTVSEISEIKGIPYYDYTVVSEDGMPSTYVHFAPTR